MRPEGGKKSLFSSGCLSKPAHGGTVLPLVGSITLAHMKTPQEDHFPFPFERARFVHLFTPA